MKCERCGTEDDVHFTGHWDGNGPSEADCFNTPENLPGGFAWLCAPCDLELWLEDCDYQQQV